MFDEKDLILEAKHVTRKFPAAKGKVLTACNDVNLKFYKGKTLGLVGESGCGKSTLGRVILRLSEITSGQVLFAGQDVFQMRPAQLKQIRKQMHLIFQDPYACLNPRLRVEDLIAEPLKLHGNPSRKGAREIARQIMSEVGLQPDIGRRFPHELSGGQQQRVGIARALVLSQFLRWMFLCKPRS